MAMTQSTKLPLKPSERIQQLADELRPQLKGSALEASEAELRLCCVIAYLGEREASVHPIARARPVDAYTTQAPDKRSDAHPAPASPPGEDKPQCGEVTVERCPDCGKLRAKIYGDGGCLALCKDPSFQDVHRCRIDTIARLRSELAAPEARCNQLTGELARVYESNSDNAGLLREARAKLTESEATVARLRKQLEGAEAVVMAARKVLSHAVWIPELRAALSALDQSQPEPASERAIVVGSTVTHRLDNRENGEVMLMRGPNANVRWPNGATFTYWVGDLVLISDPPPVSDSQEGVK